MVPAGGGAVLTAAGGRFPALGRGAVYDLVGHGSGSIRATQDSRKESPMRTKISLVALAAAALMLGGCIRIPLGAVGGTSSSREATSSARPAEPKPAIVGDTLKAMPWKVTVLRAHTSKTGAGTSLGAGHRFMLVEMEFRNIGMGAELVANPKDVTLTDSSGVRHSVKGKAAGFNTRGMRAISPGMGGWTVFVFEVPSKSASSTVTFAPKIAGKHARMRWNLP
jgi:hypothetical protein